MESKLIICIGSGGVGKTSVSAAVACKLALEGKKGTSEYKNEYDIAAGLKKYFEEKAKQRK